MSLPPEAVKAAPDGDGPEPSPSPFPLLISLGVLLITVGLVIHTQAGLNDFNREAFRVPLGLLAFAGLLAFVQAISDVRGLKLQAPDRQTRATLGRVALFLALAVGFVFAIPHTGYLVTGIGLFCCAALLTGRVNLGVMVVSAVAVPLLIYLAFGMLFSIWLPAGSIFEGLL